MLSNEERSEREPAAIQRAILELERQMAEIQPDILQANQERLEWQVKYEVLILRMKILKERRSGLQSVLKSLAII